MQRVIRRGWTNFVEFRRDHAWDKCNDITFEQRRAMT